MKQENKVGLYVTIIAHLVAAIVFLCIKISTSITETNKMVIDFSGVEEKEKAQAQEKLAQDVSSQLDELIRQRRAQNNAGHKVRNVAVDTYDEDTKKLYEDAERLQDDLANGKSLSDLEREALALENDKNHNQDTQKSNYKGPSVVSYNLGGRKASHLSIPAYKCYGGGDVTVIIAVNNQGRVVAARILTELSSEDKCLQEFALKAAKASLFSVDPKAPVKQEGDITYKFIPQ